MLICMSPSKANKYCRVNLALPSQQMTSRACSECSGHRERKRFQHWWCKRTFRAGLASYPWIGLSDFSSSKIGIQPTTVQLDGFARKIFVNIEQAFHQDKTLKRICRICKYIHNLHNMQKHSKYQDWRYIGWWDQPFKTIQPLYSAYLTYLTLFSHIQHIKFIMHISCILTYFAYCAMLCGSMQTVKKLLLHWRLIHLANVTRSTKMDRRWQRVGVSLPSVTKSMSNLMPHTAILRTWTDCSVVP